MAALPRAKTDLDKALNYEKFIQLFTNQHTKNMHDRQVGVLQRVCRHNPSGFAIADLPHVQQLVQLALEKVHEGHGQFTAPVLAIVELCANPFIARKASEKITSADAVQTMLNLLGSLLLHSDTAVQMQAVDSLTKYAQGYGCDDVPPETVTTLLDIAGFQDDIKDPTCAHDLRLPTRNWNQLQLHDSGCTSSAIGSFLRETEELFSFDTDQDGQLSREEMHRYKVMNDTVQTNDDDAYDAAAEAKREEAEASGKDTGDKPPPHFLVENIKFLLQLSYSAVNAHAILQSPVPSQLVHLLYSVQNFREPFILMIVELLTNLMDHTNEALRKAPLARSLSELLDKHRHGNAVYLLGKQDNLEVFRALLERLLTEGYRQTDKEIRNDILVACEKLAARASNHVHFVAAGFPRFLLQYATAAEMGATSADLNGGNVRNFATADPIDFEFKRLVLNLLSTLLEGPEPQVVEAVSLSNLAEVLLSYVDLGKPDTKLARSLRYSDAQTNIIRGDALELLFSILRHCPASFTDGNGHKIILDFTQGMMDGSGGPGSGGLRSLAMRVLAQSASAPGGASRLGGTLDAIPYLLDVFADHANSNADRAEALRVLTAVCSHSSPAGDGEQSASEDNQAIFRRAKGIHLLVEALRDLTPDVANQEPLLAAIVDCVWDAVVGNKRSEARLLVIDGVDALLDLLDCCSRPFRNRLVGCLADLARNPKSRHYLRIWKSDRSLRTLSAMLGSFQAEEETRLGVSRDDRGVIKNIVRPLEPAAEKPPTRLATPDTESNAKVGKRLRSALQASKATAEAAAAADPAERQRRAILEQDLRTKIYALLQALDFDAKGVSTSGGGLNGNRSPTSGRSVDEEDEATLQFEQKSQFEDESASMLGGGVADNGSLTSAEELIFLRGLQDFREFCKVAAWQDVKAELQRQGVRPIYPDTVYMEARLDHGFNLALEARADQRAIRDGEDSTKASEEAAFHGVIKHRYEQALHSEQIKKQGKATRRKAMFQ